MQQIFTKYESPLSNIININGLKLPKITTTQRIQAQKSKPIEIVNKPKIKYKIKEESREQKLLELFLKYPDEIIKAKQLAQYLEMPQNHVYKIIKNLRDAGVKIKNGKDGGFYL